MRHRAPQLSTPPGMSRRRLVLGTAAALGLGVAAVNLPSATAAVEPVTATLYIAGDSTSVTYSSRYYPWAGWGQQLSGFLSSGITVTNRAIGGRSSRSFLDEGRLAAIHGVIAPWPSTA